MAGRKADDQNMNPFTLIPRYKAIRKKRAKPRRGPMRDPEYRRWVRENHFCELWIRKPLGAIRWCEGKVEAAHTERNGMSSKGPDSSCAPLCHRHHREYDAGREAFEAKYGVDMKSVARQCWELYKAETSE
jgi:hypothetical protein